MSRILIIEDEESIAELEKDYLELSGFEVEIESKGDVGLKRALEEEFDLYILDLMLPGMDGFEICKEIRNHKNTPILMVSAKKDDIDKIRGLGLGADDYMTKPFSPSELVARVKAHMARYERLVSTNMPKNDIVEIRGIKIDKTARRVWVNGEEKAFTTMYSQKKSCSVKSGIWSRSEILRPLRYISKRFVRRLSLTQPSHSISRQSGAWDIDLRFKDVRVRSMKPRCAYTRVVLWHRLTPVFTRRNIMQEVKTPKKPFIYYLIIAATIMILLNTLVFPNVLKHQVKEVGYNVFMQMTNNQEIGSVNITDSEIFFTNKDNSQMYKTGVINDPELVDRLYKAGATFSTEITEEMSPIVYLLLGYVLPIFIFVALGRWLSKKMMSKMSDGANPMNSMMFGTKSNAKIYVKSTSGIKFSDVAGEEEAKELLTEIVDFLHNPGKYQEIGASMPKGALLVGPPGTGKTLLAKAVAGEANVPFFSISGSEFVEMFVGMGAAKVRDLFKQASEKAPCIVFIDEIDAVGKKRDGRIGGNDEREQTLNQLLTEMDGFDGSKGVVILAATNQPDSLDPALLRPGRFDRRIPVELPDLQGRVDILKVHAKKIKLADNVDFNAIARAASGASGAELANIVNEAALHAVRCGRKFATQADLMESVEVVIAGYQKKNRILSDKEKLIVSYHEVGHALVAAMQTNSAPVQKITIIPRTSGALGYTMQVEEGEHFLMNKTEMENKIATFTGGRAAEELIFGEITTGASNDIEQATKFARAMITRYGMNEEFDMVAMESVSNQYLGGDSSLTCSMETQTLIDQKVVQLVKEQHQKAKKILEDNVMKLHEIAKFLYEHETITGEEFMEILNSDSQKIIEEKQQ